MFSLCNKSAVWHGSLWLELEPSEGEERWLIAVPVPIVQEQRGV